MYIDLVHSSKYLPIMSIKNINKFDTCLAFFFDLRFFFPSYFKLIKQARPMTEVQEEKHTNTCSVELFNKAVRHSTHHAELTSGFREELLVKELLFRNTSCCKIHHSQMMMKWIKYLYRNLTQFDYIVSERKTTRLFFIILWVLLEVKHLDGQVWLGKLCVAMAKLLRQNPVFAVLFRREWRSVEVISDTTILQLQGNIQTTILMKGNKIARNLTLEELNYDVYLKKLFRNEYLDNFWIWLDFLERVMEDRNMKLPAPHPTWSKFCAKMNAIPSRCYLKYAHRFFSQTRPLGQFHVYLEHQPFNYSMMLSVAKRLEIIQLAFDTVQLNQIQQLEQELEADEKEQRLPLPLLMDNSEGEEEKKQYRFKWIVQRDQFLVSCLNLLEIKNLQYARLPLSISFLDEEITLDMGGPRHECFRLLHAHLFEHDIADDKNLNYFLWTQESFSHHFLPLRFISSETNNNTTKQDQYYDLWYKIGVLMGTALFNQQWSILQNKIPLLILLKVIKDEPITTEDFIQAFPKMWDQIQLMPEEELKEWSGETIHATGASGEESTDDSTDSGSSNVCWSQSNLKQTFIKQYGELNILNVQNTTYLCDAKTRYWWAMLGVPKVYVDQQPEHYHPRCMDNPFVNNSWVHLVRGVQKIIHGNFFKLFKPRELYLEFYKPVYESDLFNVKLLRSRTAYENFQTTALHTAHIIYLHHFWNILSGFSKQQLWTWLMFVTGDNDIVRKLNLKKTKLTIARLETDRDDLCPTAVTCFNTFKLPIYSTKTILEERLQTILKHSEGFGSI
jgi:hypothetical protein